MKAAGAEGDPEVKVICHVKQLFTSTFMVVHQPDSLQQCHSVSRLHFIMDEEAGNMGCDPE